MVFSLYFFFDSKSSGKLLAQFFDFLREETLIWLYALCSLSIILSTIRGLKKNAPENGLIHHFTTSHYQGIYLA
ncbi:uncharacterized protein RHIMIDRAFT_138433 [Rhizopus microsporus ATCC 52813]|uniref:Uncharacterized protein n=1 Tax=Rhizopus microsporus ATCC 52813 TaxID=1340429 RepID=A0A2G4ST61_RHIZD|nr:uncharacterized protein RHIMIDRAFT_138433 [Rhizopus microsporus ATCC 52813]PHZ11977.1 hypothetical protein RHIMIDRAFT_138433 [Rhizopus microsporus ATCC 52813]